jgi:hypothetical protein
MGKVRRPITSFLPIIRLSRPRRTEFVRISIRKAARRRAVSAVVAELTLIVVVLISTLVLSGIMFGSFSAYVPPAEVIPESPSCSGQSGNEVCHVTLQNQSPHSVSTSPDCEITVQGSQLAGTVSNGGTIPGSGTLTGVTCVVTGASASPGSQVVGTLPLMNYASVFFTTVSE